MSHFITNCGTLKRRNDWHEGLTRFITYRPNSCPSTLATAPSPETTAIRSWPLNHLTECNSPHVVTAIGHKRVASSPRIVETVLSGKKNENNSISILVIYF